MIAVGVVDGDGEGSVGVLVALLERRGKEYCIVVV